MFKSVAVEIGRDELIIFNIVLYLQFVGGELNWIEIKKDRKCQPECTIEA